MLLRLANLSYNASFRPLALRKTPLPSTPGSRMLRGMTRFAPLALVAVLSPFALPALLPAQAAAPSAGQAQSATPRQAGTIKVVTANDLVLTNSNGQDIAVTVPAQARILLVAPGSRDLTAAKAGSIADLAVGDKAIVSGSASDTGTTLTATRVVIMKSTAIAASHAVEEQAWAHGAGGIVRSVDTAAGTLTVASGPRTLTLDTNPGTIVRRYAGGSVRFEDAVKSSMDDIHPGDQVRARGHRSADGAVLVADEIVAGSFSNYSGTVVSVDPTKNQITLKDKATKKNVTVAVSPESNLRRLPAGMAQGLTARNGAEGASASGPRSSSTAQSDGNRPAAATGAASQTGGSARVGMGIDLSRMMNRLPPETLAGLKPGDAVMLVASGNNSAQEPTVITLLAGVEQILAASPSGQTTLSPWSLGQGGGEGEGGS